MTASSAVPVIAVIGNDLPRQLVLACGAVPHRLTGSWDGTVDAKAQELLGAADAVAVRILTELLAGRERMDALVVCNDSQAHLRLFYALRAIGWSTPVHLLDMPRADTAPARRFAAAQYRALISFCAGVTGKAPDGAILRTAGSEEHSLGDALGALRERRRAGACSGTESLEAVLAAGRLAPVEAGRLLDATGIGGAAGDGIRLHVTGSNHPDATAYRVLEQHGAVVVSEDHDTGDGAWLGHAVDSDDIDDVVTGLIDAHIDRIATSSTSSAAARAQLTATGAGVSGAAAVIALIRDLDEAPLWDLADQQEALAALGIPFVVRSRMAADGTATAADEATAAVRTGARA